jgi:hypothetical protein
MGMCKRFYKGLYTLFYRELYKQFCMGIHVETFRTLCVEPSNELHRSKNKRTWK